MSDEETKPRRRRRRGQVPTVSEAPPPAPVNPEDVAQSEQREAASKNERASAELLRLLMVNHRHGYGEYNTGK